VNSRTRIRGDGVLGIIQLRGLLDDDFAVEVDRVQHLQHVAFVDHLLGL
jgi:hypothetical protein